MSLEEFSEELAALVEVASGSVVGVGRAGSGVVVAEGLVVTNAHNLRQEVEVYFPDGGTAQATVPGADLDGDVAVLSVPTGDHRPLEWPTSGGAPRLGEIVIGLSRPGGRSLRAGIGSISALDVTFRGPGGSTVTGALEHSALLARGSSGGPLLDTEGRLLGINTHRQGDGFYLALPAGTELKERVEALARGEVPRRPRLGVALAPPRAARHLRRAVGLPPRDGLLVHAVDPDGAAGRAGVRAGDLIVSVGGSQVGTVEDLAHALEAVGEGGVADLLVVRGADEVSVAVQFDHGGPAEQGTA